MKKRILALLLALLLLVPLGACKRNKGDEPPYTPNGGTESISDGEENEGNSQDGPLPVGFSLYFVGEGGYGLDIANNRLLHGAESKNFDFSAILNALYYDMTECNIYAICRATPDLTYKAISGQEPTGENELYQLTFTDNGETYSIKTDKAALAAYQDTRSDISNLRSLVTNFSGFVRTRYE